MIFCVGLSVRAVLLFTSEQTVFFYLFVYPLLGSSSFPTFLASSDSLRIPETNKVAFPALNTTQSRCRTYTRWPKDLGVSIDALAEAGFFSTGLADWVQCFHCGGGLHSWRQGDDPWTEHSRFYPYCPFVRMQRGEDTVIRCWKENPAPCVPPRPIALTPEESDLLLHHPVAKVASHSHAKTGLPSSPLPPPLSH